MTATPHLLHVFSTFGRGGPQVRTSSIINSLGAEFRHSILAMDGCRDALSQVREPVVCLEPPPARNPLLVPIQLRRLLRREQPNLVLTYNWGAIEAVLAARSLLLPVIHTEDGFGPDEAHALLPRRVWARRILLRTGVRTVVPSRTLEDIGILQYCLPRISVEYIPNGIDVSHFHPGRATTLRTALGITDEEIVFGSVGGLRPEKNLHFLLRAFRQAAIPNSRLVLVGDGACRRTLENLAAGLGIASKVIFTAAVADPAEHYRALDIFAMCSITEQMPVALLEAMATGLPVLCTAVGDTTLLLGPDQQPYIFKSGDLAEYVRAMRILAGDARLRAHLGTRNRERCQTAYSLNKMIERYGQLYRTAIAGVGHPARRQTTRGADHSYDQACPPWD